jgi:hypothetical protein
LSTTVASARSTGPNTANTEVLSVANCSSKRVSGGGARVEPLRPPPAPRTIAC